MTQPLGDMRRQWTSSAALGPSVCRGLQRNLHGTSRLLCPLVRPSAFTGQNVREWLSQLNGKTLHIEPGSPWGNAYINALNVKLRDELLEG